MLALTDTRSGRDLGSNDFVTIAGTADYVSANDETVVIYVSGVTSYANIELGNGNDIITLGGDGGSVTGTGTGTTTVNQSTGFATSVAVSLNNGSGLVTLGDGNDSVTANGKFSQIGVGGGSDTVVANGANDSVALNNDNGSYGTYYLTANGAATPSPPAWPAALTAPTTLQRMVPVTA